MGSHPPFQAWVAAVASDPIVFDDEINVEARANVWSFGIANDEAETLVREDIVEFVFDVAALRERRILEEVGRTRPMVFYCWFDEQAGNLRIGLVSAHHGYLPFGAIVQPTDLESIAGALLTMPTTMGSRWRSSGL
jgi:hypothetical protein